MANINRLPNEVIDGECEYNQSLRNQFREVFDILSQPDLESRIEHAKSGFKPENEYFDRCTRGGEWQKPTQLHHFDTEKYSGTIVRITNMYSNDHADPALAYKTYGNPETFEVSFRMNETLTVRYVSKDELKSITKTPQIKRKRIYLPVIATDEKLRYADHEGKGHGLNIPYIPRYQISNLRDLKVESQDHSKLKILVGEVNPLEFIVNLEEQGGSK